MKDNVNPQQIEAIKNWLGTGSIDIFGPQYAGKDTQGHMLVEVLDAAPLMGGGDILRNSIVPEHIKKIMNEGRLIPTPDYIAIVLPHLSKPEFAGKPLVLSAFGRWYGEEKGMLQVATQSNHPLKAIVYLSLSETESWERWKKINPLSRNGGIRQDEAEYALEMRLKEFREKTLPVIDFYRSMGILIEVDGNQPPKKVFSDIIAGLLEFAQKEN